MDSFRNLARQHLENLDYSSISHTNTAGLESQSLNLRELWDDINAHTEPKKDLNVRSPEIL